MLKTTHRTFVEAAQILFKTKQPHEQAEEFIRNGMDNVEVLGFILRTLPTDAPKTAVVYATPATVVLQMRDDTMALYSDGRLQKLNNPNRVTNDVKTPITWMAVPQTLPLSNAFAFAVSADKIILGSAIAIAKQLNKELEQDNLTEHQRTDICDFLRNPPHPSSPYDKSRKAVIPTTTTTRPASRRKFPAPITAFLAKFGRQPSGAIPTG
jgi:hypothetical protein